MLVGSFLHTYIFALIDPVIGVAILQSRAQTASLVTVNIITRSTIHGRSGKVMMDKNVVT